MTEIIINIKFTGKNFGLWQDTQKRSEHVFDRMKLRGIGVKQMKEAINKGAKIFRSDGSLVAEYRWLKVAYREYRLGKIRKIYPITVVEAY